MATIHDKRNALLGEKLVAALKARHFDAYYVPTASDMLQLAQQLIAEGSVVTWGGSDTIRSTGLTAMLKGGNYHVIDRDDVTTAEDKRRVYLQAFDADWYLASANAMSQDGQIVNIDGNGNRVAATTWGPRHVLYVVGINKVAPDLDSAIKRARNTAAPLNMQRFDLNTPCHSTGMCHDCKSPDSICTYISVQRLSHPAGRHTVIIVGEELGY